MTNNNAIRLLDYYLTNDPAILEDASFATNVAVYSFLKDEFQKGDVSVNPLFQWTFSAFYGMGIVPAESREAFFSKMESLRNTNTVIDARQLTEELRPAMGKSYFSFATKMLNLLDDTGYPIYDRMVGLVFQKPFNPDETRLDHQHSIYLDIIDTYRSLKDHPIVGRFRKRFNCQEIGYMKILDSVFWKLGSMMDQNHEMFPWE